MPIFFANVFPMLQRGVQGMLILATTIFGVMAAMGMLEKVGRDSIMLLLKVSAVIYFVSNSEDIYNFSLLAMDSSTEAIVTYVPKDGRSDHTEGSDFRQIGCMRNMQQTQGIARVVYLYTLQRAFLTDSVSGPWMAVDCMIDSVIGIRIPDASGNVVDERVYNQQISKDAKGVSRGLIYLFYGVMQTSMVGVAIAILGTIYIWGLVNLLIKSLFIYIGGYIGLAVLMIFAPLFIPLVLFQATRGYFDKWIRLIIAFALQPVIIIVFVIFSMMAVDLATFSGKYSIVYTIAGEASRQPNFSLNDYLSKKQVGGPYNGKAIVDDQQREYARAKTDSLTDTQLLDKTQSSLVETLDNSKCTQALIDSDPQVKEMCKDSYPLSFFTKAMNWDMLAYYRFPPVMIPPGPNPPATGGEQILREVVSSLIFAALVIFVMNQLLTAIPQVANDLLGEFGQTPDLSKVGGVIPGAGKMNSLLSAGIKQVPR